MNKAMKYTGYLLICSLILASITSKCRSLDNRQPNELENCESVLKETKLISEKYGVIVYPQQIYEDTIFKALLSTISIKDSSCYLSFLKNDLIKHQDKLVLISILLNGFSNDDLISFCSNFIDNLTYNPSQQELSVISRLFINQDGQFKFVQNYRSLKVRRMFERLQVKCKANDQWSVVISKILSGEYQEDLAN